MTEKAKLMDVLFASGVEHVNIKFFRGDKVDLSEDEFAREVNRALAQVADGSSPGSRRFPDVGETVDTSEFVRAL